MLALLNGNDETRRERIKFSCCSISHSLIALFSTSLSIQRVTILFKVFPVQMLILIWKFGLQRKLNFSFNHTEVLRVMPVRNAHTLRERGRKYFGTVDSMLHATSIN